MSKQHGGAGLSSLHHFRPKEFVMLFAPITKRFIGPVAAIGIAASALVGCSADTSAFNVGGCLSADSIRQGKCTPTDAVDPADYFGQGLSCMHAIGGPVWPSVWIGGDREVPPPYDPDKAKQRWYCLNPSETY